MKYKKHKTHLEARIKAWEAIKGYNPYSGYKYTKPGSEKS